ncbi:hypothetical protein ERO13_A03G108233v2, partial [Gossypium hirsutum]
ETRFVSKEWTFLLGLGCFCAGMLFTDSNRMGTDPEPKGIKRTTAVEAEKLKLISEGCNPKTKEEKHVSKRIIGEVFKTHHAIQTLDKTILNLEMELTAARAAQESLLSKSSRKRKYLMVIGINTAFSSRKRRDSARATWMPQGEKRNKLEDEKSIIVLFVIIESYIFRMTVTMQGCKWITITDHVEGYLELSAKPKIYFATALALWDADFYVKVDDDVDVNIETLVRHRKKHCVFLGCMKSGPVLSQKGVRCNEPEYWQFGESGNKYFRHATRKFYAISKDLASYISINHLIQIMKSVCSNEWTTNADCEWKAQAGNACVASFD